MRLTVGPLPAAVYWRRRAVVLAALAIVVLIVAYSCGDPNSSNPGPGIAATAGPSPSATTTLLRPTSPSATPSPSPTAYTLPTATAAENGPCTDAEIAVTVRAGSPEVTRGNPASFTITIGNTSARTCSRDIGADMQELRLTFGKAIIWSSDDCSPNQGHDLRSFAAGQSISFTLTWQGRRSRTGTGQRDCSGVALPDVGEYQLLGRLDQIVSQPFSLRIKA